MPKVKCVCKYCGKKFDRYPSLVGPYCSIGCCNADKANCWTIAEVQELGERYPDGNIARIAQDLGRTEFAVRTKAQKLGIYRSGFKFQSMPSGEVRHIKYVINEQFFDTWTPEMAYVLGFIVADGCITKNGLLKFSSTDPELLYKIRDVMESEHPIREHWDKLSKKPIYDFMICRKYFVGSLARHGIHPRKTKSIHWPDSPSAMFPHIARGYFDGDGYVNCAINRAYSDRLTVFFTSASPFLLPEFHAALSRAGVQGGSLRESSRYPGNFRLQLSTHAGLSLYHLMYSQVDDLYLDRKRRPFERYLENAELRYKGGHPITRSTIHQ